jgi:hypothetical protein
MNYYESVVIDFLRADRAIFVNTEYCMQINAGSNPDISGPHWYCDAVAIDFRSEQTFLCEISYSKSLGSIPNGNVVKGTGLAGRLHGWNENWPRICSALERDSFIPVNWLVRPWLFVPNDMIARLTKILTSIACEGALVFPTPRITPLEDVVPWKYQSWNRAAYESIHGPDL